MRGAATAALVVGLIAAAGSAGAQTAAGGATNGLVVENPVLDIGEVRGGADAIGVFVFHNPTDKDIKILHAKPS